MKKMMRTVFSTSPTNKGPLYLPKNKKKRGSSVFLPLCHDL